MTFSLTLLLALLSPSPAQAADGVVSRVVASLGSEIDLFADCDRSKRKPLLLAASGGTVRQIRLKCREGNGAFDVYLSYQPKGGEPGTDFLKEVYLKADNDDAEARLAALADQVAGGGSERELAFVRYRSSQAVTDLTVSLGDFSWELLPGASYFEKLRAQNEKHASVQVSGPFTLKVIGTGKVDVAVTTFGSEEQSPAMPGWAVVHWVTADGTAKRLTARLAHGEITAFPLGSDEGALRLAGVTSEFYRIDATEKKLVKLALAESFTDTLASPDCQVKGICRETRYALMPSSKPSPNSYYAFDMVRVEIQRDRVGTVQKSSERVVGTCLYDLGKKDFACPAAATTTAIKTISP